jgi:predicted nucleotidyltransferase
MRIEQQQIDFIKKKIAETRLVFRLFLFGSRADDRARGGDIDMLILSDPPLSRQDIRLLKVAFQQQFGEQKLDLLAFAPDSQDPFKELALSEGIEL